MKAKAYDQFFDTTEVTYNLTVVHTNHKPHINSTPSTDAHQDVKYVYVVTATDADAGDTLTYSFPNLPSWLHQDSVTIISGTPGAGNFDTTVSAQVSDGKGGVDVQTFTLHVIHPNSAPGPFDRISPIDSAVVTLSGTFAVAWGRSIDPDPGDTVRYVLHVIVPFAGRDTSFIVPDTGITVPLAGLGIPAFQGRILIEWEVTATDGKAFTPASNGQGGFYIENQDVVTDPKRLPTSYSLSQNYPNPFNPTTEIGYDLPEMSDVQVTIYNVIGMEVRTLAAGMQPAGSYHLQWDGTNNQGMQISSGLYLYRIIAHGVDGKIFTVTRKMTMMK